MKRDDQVTNIASNDAFTVDREKVMNIVFTSYFEFGKPSNFSA